jgi:hypothetical protein
MKPLLRHPFHCLAALAITALLSACGGGGTAGQPSQANTAVAAPAQFSSDDLAAGAYTLIPATPPTDTGGEEPYPELRNLPTQAMPFQPVAYGDVAGIAVTAAP